MRNKKKKFSIKRDMDGFWRTKPSKEKFIWLRNAIKETVQEILKSANSSVREIESIEITVTFKKGGKYV